MPGAGTSRPASVGTGAAVLAGLWLLLSTGDSRLGTLLLTIAAGLLGVAVLLRATASPLRTGVASLLSLLVALFGLGGVSVCLIAAGMPGFLAGDLALGRFLKGVVETLGLGLGAALAVFGTVGTLRDGVGEGAVTNFWHSVIVTFGVVLIGLGVIVIPRFGIVSQLWPSTLPLSTPLDAVFSPSNAVLGLVTFPVLVAGALVTASWVLRTGPFLELAPADRRDHFETIHARIQRVLRWAIRISGLVALAVTLAALAEAIEPGMITTTPLALTLSPGVRIGLVGATVLFGGVGLALSVIRGLAGSVWTVLQKTLPAMTGGVAGLLLAVLVAPLVEGLTAGLPPAVRGSATTLIQTVSPVGIVLGTLAVALGLLVAILTTLGIAGTVRYIPHRAAAGALAAAGLTIGAIAVGTTSDEPVVVFALVALALVVWDVSERGVVVRAELGIRPSPYIETVHALGTLLVAAIGFTVAWATHSTVLGSVTVPDGALVGTVAASAGVVLLLIFLRG